MNGLRTKLGPIRAGVLREPGGGRVRIQAVARVPVDGGELALMGEPSIDAAEREALALVVSGRPMTAPIASLGHTGAASGTINGASQSFAP